MSPKAIFTRTEYRPVREGQGVVRSVQGARIEISGVQWPADNLGGGDFFLRWGLVAPRAIVGLEAPYVTVASIGGNESLPATGDNCEIAVRLQKPHVDPHRCIGCGVCEHECPVQGRRAIRVSAENESRHPKHRMVL